MRVLVLGGAGGMGRVAVERVGAFDFVECVTAADLDEGRAIQVAARLGGRGRGIRLDVNDRAAMRNAVEAHDVVLNAVGPFYVLGLSVLEQVIEAGRAYADICDDWEPTLEMLALSSRAHQTETLAIVGLGASPGVTNLLAMKAAAALDEVDEILTGWSIEGSNDDLSALQTAHPKATGASAAVVHWVQQLTGSIQVLRDGGSQNVKPLERIVIEYPGFGRLPVWSVGHPEAVTLPRAKSGLLACSNVMVGQDQTFEGLSLLASLVDSGALTVHQAADEIARNAASLAKAPERRENKRIAPALFAWASGRINGRAAIAAAAVLGMPPGGMAGATSVPLSLALPLLRRGFAERSGVFAPEELIDPDAFFDLLAPLCAGGFKSGSDLVALERIVSDA